MDNETDNKEEMRNFIVAIFNDDGRQVSEAMNIKAFNQYQAMEFAFDKFEMGLYADILNF